MSGPLAGLNIIEIAGVGPAPTCGMMLADMGANIIRIDRPAKSDLGVAVSEGYSIRDRNKRSVAMDLKQPAGVAALLRLVERSDVLIEGFRPGVTERLGFGPDSCFAINPALVYGRATGWGQDGPLAAAAGHDINYLSLTGALDMIGPHGGDPVVPLNLVGDNAAGAAYLAFGIMCAVFEARNSGKGQVVDGAIVDGVTGLLTMFHALRQSGELAPARGSNVLDGGAPYYTVYRTAEGRHMAVGAIEQRFYDQFIEVLGLAPAQLPDRRVQANWAELREIFSREFARHTRDDWVERFASRPDACVSPVLTLEEAPRHPHNVARHMLVPFHGIDHPLPSPRMSRTPGMIVSPPPTPGEHTREILREWGFCDDEISSGLQDKVFFESATKRP